MLYKKHEMAPCIFEIFHLWVNTYLSYFESYNTEDNICKVEYNQVISEWNELNCTNEMTSIITFV